jgi:undecaprenyl-diphosphatase
VIIICGAAVLACLAARRYRGALLFAVAVPLASGLTEGVLKPLVGRTLGGGLSYPSGHLTVVSAMAVAGLVLLFGPARPPLPATLRWLLTVVIALVVAAVAVCLIAVHFHYFTDTIGGAAVGAGTVMLTALVLDRLAGRLSRPVWAARPAWPPRAAREGRADSRAGDGMTPAARGLPPA